jgi:tRNA threonylcarbamoyladenosine biosynthesis protein TsaE
MDFNYTLNQIDDIAKRILSSTKRKIFLFYGSMGVGKTTIIKAFAKELGVTDNVSSPTFSLVNEYLDERGKPLYHFDFYRIENEEEALDMGIEEYFDVDAYCFIEWPEKIKNLLPLDAVNVFILENENSTRSITLENYE